MNLDTTGKKLLAAVAVAIAAFLLWWSGWLSSGDPTPLPSPIPSVSALPSPSASPSPAVTSSPSPSPTSSSQPSPSPSPSASPMVGTVEILDSWDRPEFAPASAWVTSVSRQVMAGNVDSIVFRTSGPCAFVDGIPKVWKLTPLVTTKGSAPTYPTGTFYDRMEPLSAANCAGSKYLQVDFQPPRSGPYAVGSAKVDYLLKGVMPAKPLVPIEIEFNPSAMIKGYCNGVYCGNGVGGVSANLEMLTPQGTGVMNAHRMSTYKSWPGGTMSWSTYQKAASLGRPFINAGAVGSAPAEAIAWANANPGQGYSYPIDEPGGSQLAATLKLLQDWKAASPGTLRMVTTALKYRDLNSASPTYGKNLPWPKEIVDLIDIFTVPAETFCQESWKGSGDVYPCRSDYTAAGKKLWLYVANGSNGAEGGQATGGPDLVIDRNAGEMFGFVMMALKFDAEGLLYYNSAEGWWKVPGQDINVNPYQLGCWGDGILLYPDRVNRLAMASMRLKALRLASYWADAVLLAKAKDPAWFTSRVLPLMTDTFHFERSTEVYRTVYAEALGRL